MLTNDEKLFLKYWEKNRENEKRFFRQLTYGSPWGLVFALPVLVVVIFHDWYKNMIPISRSQIILIIIAVMGIAVFYSVFRMKFKWDSNEQIYKELKFKEKKNDAADL
ncbi:MAG: hypothetical protein M3Z26_13395 [Bacteroidota bacterium]|nr:hypothetical protein [Bacteroidota bacterium]